MLKVITISTFIAVISFCQLTHAEVVDESWRQVYEFQSKMAAQGNSKAQFTLGEMYEYGRGVKKNYDVAIDWYDKAKSNGHEEAAERIAMIHQSRKQEAEEKKQAAAQQKAEEELARQRALEKERAAAAKRKKEALEKKRAAKAAKKKKIQQAKLTPEQRAKKIKEAQERAKAIAKENELKQQKAADAALQKYRNSIVKNQKPAEIKETKETKIPEKYIDPFE